MRPFVSLNPIKVDLFGHASLLLSIIPKHLLGLGLAQPRPPIEKHNWGQLRSVQFLSNDQFLIANTQDFISHVSAEQLFFDRLLLWGRPGHKQSSTELICLQRQKGVRQAVVVAKRPTT